MRFECLLPQRQKFGELVDQENLPSQHIIKLLEASNKQRKVFIVKVA
jgi:hypothetical protein